MDRALCPADQGPALTAPDGCVKPDTRTGPENPTRLSTNTKDYGWNRPASNGMTRVRKLHIKSYGCQMNVYDANRMADTLAPIGFVETGMAEQADLIILNTCH